MDRILASLLVRVEAGDEMRLREDDQELRELSPCAQSCSNQTQWLS